MRKFRYAKIGMLVLLSFIFFLSSPKVIAQSCNQVEILYTEPDCFKERHAGTGQPSDQRGCKEVAACVDQPYVYTSSMIGGGFTYLWTVTGPGPVTINPNNTSPQVNIVWPLVGSYTLTITVTTPGGTFTNCITVNVKDKPVAGFTFTPNNVCAGSTISFTNTTTFAGGGIIYSWNFDDPASGANNYSTATNPTHIFGAPGTYNVMLIASSFSTSVVVVQGKPDTLITSCCSDTFSLPVTIVPGTLVIECISTVCAGDTVTYSAVGCLNTNWLPPVGGTIISSTPTTVTIVWGNGAVQGQIIAMCPGGCTTSVLVPIIPLNPQPVGNLIPCDNATTSYSLPLLPGTFYTWSLNNITNGNNYDPNLYTYPENNTVWIDWSLLPPGVYQLTVVLENKHTCCIQTGTITITPKGRFQALSNQTVCQFNAATLFTSGPGSFDWQTLPAGGVAPPSLPASLTYNPTFANIGVYTVTATETGGNYCNTTHQVTVTVVPAGVPGVINGPVTVCTNSTASYSMSINAPPGYHYEWSITGGAGTFQPLNLPTTTGDNASILWTSVPGTISVVLVRNSAPLCPSAIVTLNVNIAVTGTVSGPVNVCVDGTSVYNLTGGTLPPGEPVNWTISPANHGSILSGQGTSSITVLWHGQPGTGPWGPVIVSATSACGAATALPGIMIYPKFTFTLAQTSDICQPGGVTISVVGAPPSPTYAWSNGATTPTISVLFAGPYSCTITNPGGCSYTANILVEDPFIVGPVTCGVGYCVASGATNEVLGVIIIKPVVGPFTYQWYTGVFPGGAIIPGENGPGYTAPDSGKYYCLVTYGNCTKNVDFSVAKVCCPDVNNPQITSIVQNDCFTFTFTGTTPNIIDSIWWDFGDGTGAPGVSGVPISHTYVHAGTYCVKFCVGPPGINPTNCTGNCISRNVTVPIEAAFIPALSCNGCLAVQNTSIIISPPGFISYFWDFGDGNTSILANPPPHCYALGGTYTVSLTITYNNGVLAPCTSTATSTITYTPLSILVNPAIVCTNSPVTFTSNPSGFITWNWSFGDGFNAFTPSTTHIYTTPALGVPVSLTVLDITGVTCVAKDTIDVFPGSPCPILPAYICPGSFATINGPAGGISYLWEQFVAGVWVAAPGVNTNQNYNTTTPGQYHVIVTNGNGCICISNAVQVLAVTAPDAVIAISPSKKLCGPSFITLTSVNHLTGYTSNWYAGGFGNPIGSGQTLPTPIGGTTTIILVLFNQYQCSDTCYVQVEVNAPPAPPIIVSNPGGPLCAGQPIVLTVSNYPNNNNVSWNTGALGNTITVYNAGSYTATFTSPVTGCSSSSSITVNARPSSDLYPHNCDSIPCECVRPFAIYAPLPLIGPYAVNYNIQWWNSNTNTQIFTGIGPGGLVYHNLPSGVQTGSYYIVMTDPNTGCSDTSNNYSVVVPPCDTCNCEESYWGNITLTPVVDPVPGNEVSNVIIVPVPLVLKCDSVYTIECNKPYIVNASFICGGDTSKCPGLTTYAFTPPGGPTQTGNTPFTFVPTVSGTYTLMLYGWCNGKICDSCKIIFRVVCPPACDCINSHWGEIMMVSGDQQATTFINCKQEYTLPCNVPITINASYICAGANCPDSVSYALTNPLGATITGGGALTFTPTISGTYTLVLYGYCGNKLCDSCKITFKVSCPPACDCTNSHWGEIMMVSGDPQVTTFIGCKQEYTVPCNVPISINASYICAGAHCPDSVSYALTNPLGATITGGGALTFTPTISGTYTLVLYGYCGTKLCDSCKITFKVSCPPVCDCKGSYWGTTTWVSGAAGIVHPVECNTNVTLLCGVPVTINSSYICAVAGCTDSVSYALTNPLGGVTTGPVAFTFTPTISGTYTLMLYGYCGGILCDSCKITFTTQCEPLCNCAGSKWGNIIMSPGNLPVSVKLKCDKQYTVPCNQPLTINAAYNCVGANCPGTVTYKLTDPGGVTTTGTVGFTFTPTQSGIYTLVLYGYCGTTLCDSCKITFKVSCPPLCTCNGSQWEFINMTSGVPQVTKQLNCNKQYSVPCNVPISINALYLCNPTNCNDTVTYALTTPAGVTTTGNVAFTFTPNQSGIYTLMLYGYCGGKICDSCKITFKVECCSCHGSQWEFINMKSGNPQVTKPLSCNKQYAVPCNVPITINALYLCNPTSCSDTVTYALTTPAGVTTTGNVAFTFNPTQSGTYTLMLYGYCGGKICDSCKITFKVECCSCNGSQWEFINMKSGQPQVTKQLNCNKQYTVPCNVPITINALYLCTPTNCGDTVTYALTTPSGVTTTGNVAFTFNPTQSGIYTLMLYGYCGGKICDSCKITFKVECCTCHGSQWEFINMSSGNPQVTKPLSCNKQYVVPCNMPITINALYLCNPTSCSGAATYALTTPAGVTTTGNVAFTFNPNQTGIYTLKLYGYCGGKICDSCTITFKVDCCNCNNSQWELITMKSGTPPVTKQVYCNQQYTVPCNVPITMNALFLCNNSSCNGAVGYQLTTPAGVTTTGNLAFTFNPTQTGTYTLKLYGYCGTKICDSCTITFKVDCCNCNGSHWDEIMMKSGQPQVTTALSCSKQYTIPCNVPVTINAGYDCVSENCESPVTYKLKTPAGVTTTGNTSFTFNPTQTGIYTLTLYGYCGSKICDSCTITFKVDCCNCNNSQWELITMASGTPPVTKQAYCNQVYTVPCNVPITMNALYLCNTNSCNGAAGYQLTTPSGAITTGNLPFSFTPSQSGTYTLKLYGYCGGKICDSCTIRFVTTCQPACNCNGSKWGNILAKSGTPPATRELKCNKEYSLPCNVPVTIEPNYLCNGAGCSGSVRYLLTAPSGTATSGRGSFSFTPTQHGIYRLTLYGYCDAGVCDTCTITFQVNCGAITMVRPKGKMKK
ncbi:MAG: PKD domain-containing protein [Bacteroidota bacterium]